MSKKRSWFCFGGHTIRSAYEKVTIPQQVFADGVLEYDDDSVFTVIDSQGRYAITQNPGGFRGVDVAEFKQFTSISRPDGGKTRVLQLLKSVLVDDSTPITYDEPVVFCATEEMIEPEDHTLYLLTFEQLAESIHGPDMWKRAIDVEQIETILSRHELSAVADEGNHLKEMVPTETTGESYQSHPEVTVLGSAQDGGVPQIDCACSNCEQARENDRPRYVSSLEITATKGRTFRYVIDPSPDLRFQTQTDHIDGVFITHAHIGQVTGLLQFGNEVSDSLRLPIYCTPDLEEYLFSSSGPFSALAEANNIQINNIHGGETIDLVGCEITPYSVPHEYSPTETLAFYIEGIGRSLLYISDIDRWTKRLSELVQRVDIAIVDGCFWDANEIGRQESVPHPPIPRTMDTFREVDTDIYFTNINHSNPVIDTESEEHRQLKHSEFNLAQRDLEFQLLEPAASALTEEDS
jgi:pyrroloquinoline quinone biosynthesis protein B